MYVEKTLSFLTCIYMYISWVCCLWARYLWVPIQIEWSVSLKRTYILSISFGLTKKFFFFFLLFSSFFFSFFSFHFQHQKWWSHWQRRICSSHSKKNSKIRYFFARFILCRWMEKTGTIKWFNKSKNSWCGHSEKPWKEFCYCSKKWLQPRNNWLHQISRCKGKVGGWWKEVGC